MFGTYVLVFCITAQLLRVHFTKALSQILSKYQEIEYPDIYAMRCHDLHFPVRK